jgi:hypothetical protein
MVARLPEQENFMSPRMSTCRAIQVVMVPESVARMASSSSSLLSSWATTCGFIGVSVRVARSCISSRQSFMPAWPEVRNERSSLYWSRGSRAEITFAESPTRPASTG